MRREKALARCSDFKISRYSFQKSSKVPGTMYNLTGLSKPWTSVPHQKQHGLTRSHRLAKSARWRNSRVSLWSCVMSSSAWRSQREATQMATLGKLERMELWPWRLWGEWLDNHTKDVMTSLFIPKQILIGQLLSQNANVKTHSSRISREKKSTRGNVANVAELTA